MTTALSNAVKFNTLYCLHLSMSKSDEKYIRVTFQYIFGSDKKKWDELTPELLSYKSIVIVDDFKDPHPIYRATKTCISHSMEITIYQPRILVEYCDLMTSISTVSQGFLFCCCIFKISQPVS
jgi:hypothetical protein